MFPIYERTKSLIKARGISQAQFCRDIGISKNVVKNWETVAPNLDNLVATARYFEVSVDYLLGLTDEKTQPAASKNLSVKRMALLEYLENTDLTDKQSETILKMVCDLQEFPKHKQVDASQQEKVQ